MKSYQLLVFDWEGTLASFCRHRRQDTFFEGVADLLKRLHADNYDLAIATGKGRVALDNALNTQELAQVSSVFFTSRTPDECPGKPAPDMLFEIMAQAGVEPQQTLMIGDSLCDLQMAQQAGVNSVAIVGRSLRLDPFLRYDPIACLENVVSLEKWLFTGENHGRTC